MWQWKPPTPRRFTTDGPVIAALDNHGDGFVNAIPVKTREAGTGHLEDAANRDMLRVPLTANENYQIMVDVGSRQTAPPLAAQPPPGRTGYRATTLPRLPDRHPPDRRPIR